MAAEAGAGVELSSCCWLLAVGADETLDEVPDVAGLGQTLVCLAGLLLGLLGFLALDSLGLPGFGLLSRFGFLRLLLNLLGFLALDALGLAGLRLFSRFDFLDLLARSLL